MAVSEPLQQREGGGMMTTMDETSGRAGERIPSGNRVKSRPAKDAVINGILSQLGSLDTSQTYDAARHTSFTKSSFSDFDQGSRPQSPAFANPPVIAFSPSNAVKPPSGVSYSDDDEATDTATPPIVPTVRSPGRSSQKIASRSLSYGGYDAGASSGGSPKRTSLVSSSREAKRALRDSSIASSSRHVPDSPAPTIRRLRRVESHETLRQAEPDKDFTPDSDFIFNGLGILATNPPAVDDAPFISPRMSSQKVLGKASLLLQADERDEGPQTVTSEDLAVKASDGASIRSDLSRGSAAGPSTPIISKIRTLPTRSPISDSIPLRTSSLRLSQSPASTKRRARQKTSARAGSLVRTISEDTQDEQWAGLGEDDVTVRRIRELRKKRESRLMSEDMSTTSGRLSPSLTRDSMDTPRGPASIASTNAIPNAANLDPGRDTREVHPASSSTGASAEVDERPPADDISRPLSLDYSYVHAVDALRRASIETSPHRSDSQQRKGMSAVRPFIAIQHRRTNSSTSNNVSPLRPKKQREKYLLDDGDEKGRRRKSMSDARKPGDEGFEPTRRDSVEGAILEYLAEPRLSQHVLDPHSGRRISFSEVGDPKGAAVLVCVGMGLTRFVTAFFDELATTLRLRLITIERPGVGDSEPYPPNDRSGPLMWASDVSAVTDHLGISKFSMLAHSAGAVYALGTALTLPHYVRGSIHLLAPWIPPSQLGAVSYPTDNSIPAGALPRSQRILRVLPAPFLRMANNSYVFSSLKPEKRKSGSSPEEGKNRTSSESPGRIKVKRPTTASSVRPERPDNPRRESMMLMDQFMPETNPMENFPLSRNDDQKDPVEKRRSSIFLGATISPNDPSFTFAGEALSAAEHSARERQSDFSSRLTQRTWEYAIKDSNPATDLLVCLERNREIGFRYTDVVRRVVITHGSEDKRVPVGNVKWLADQMNRAVMSRYAASRDTLSHDSGAEPGCELRVLEGEGHGLMASPIIMADILTEIAGYWSAEERGRRPSHTM